MTDGCVPALFTRPSNHDHALFANRELCKEFFPNLDIDSNGHLDYIVYLDYKS
jgi:hypothetical protein